MSIFTTSASSISQSARKMKHLINAARSEVKEDLVLRNADYVSIFTSEICRGDITISEGRITGIGEYRGILEIDATDLTIAPGFIDAHIHIESALVSSVSFARAVIPHGTTSVITDPHEIANICGTDGIDYLLDATDELPLDVYHAPLLCPVREFRGKRDCAGLAGHRRIFRSSSRSGICGNDELSGGNRSKP